MFQAALFFGDLVGAFGLTYLLTRLVDWCSRRWGDDDGGEPPGGWRWRRRPRPDEGRGPGPRAAHRMMRGRSPRRSVR